ncbi:tripartite tricarboxylate transporter substrate binding protein [Aurantimonas sp. Leaf443]|uniref:Bug family tripartite tricarboxylate transporter substrate binding protein n=1 Tax=Aurantimonas sp. Leaf443 TaxID=1736378 RepID=UPI0006F22062|nr:tripartite tricarboxylate transporter substrate binding protein [Aurantimonas sp. Leaf443]KQT83858.1 LacI family transcriptional regulator [Aurantimonas sp. Leaf443]
MTSLFARLAVTGCALLAAAGAPALAQTYPDKPVTIVVPFPPGGATDTTARLMEAGMAKALGQTVLVENKPGATGSIGATEVAQSDPDGYRLMIASLGTFATNPYLQRNLAYDPIKDFDLLTVAVRTPNVLVAAKQDPAKTVAELVERMKADPAGVTFASSGTGSSDHLTAALFMQAVGAEGVHVPYKGGSAAQTDLLGGHVDVSFQNLGAILGYVKAGELKALAVTSEQRHPLLPDVPTLSELGYPTVVVNSWQGVAAPKGLPTEVKAKLNEAIQASLKEPAAVSKFGELGFEVVGNSNDAFAAYLGEEMARWKDVIEKGGIQAE